MGASAGGVPENTYDERRRHWEFNFSGAQSIVVLGFESKTAKGNDFCGGPEPRNKEPVSDEFSNSLGLNV